MYIDAETIYKDISKLNISEKKALLSKLLNEMNVALNEKNKISIKDLKGLGKEVWDNTEAQNYVKSERSLWR